MYHNLPAFLKKSLCVKLDVFFQEFFMDSKIYAIPNAVMRGTGEGLFDHIAECLADFVHDREIGHEVLPLGFTFSFPCYQVKKETCLY